MHHFSRCIAFLVCLAGSLSPGDLGPVAFAQPVIAETEVANSPEDIHQQQPGFFVRVGLNHANFTYTEGDSLTLQVISEVDAYLYVLYQQADGKTFQIFPNSAQPDNRVKSKQPVAVPAADDPFRWHIGPPFGREKLLVIAARRPIEVLSNPALRRERFNPVTKDLIVNLASSLKEIEPNQWTECLMMLTTSARQVAPLEPAIKRFGVFFGVSQYEFGSESGLDLKYCDRDAERSAETFRQLGRMNASEVFVNDQATRANLERAITQWLPSVSRPGDTVFIFFSGHGAQIPDDNGDESDRIDELLLPYDFWTLKLLASLTRKLEQGQLDSRLKPRVVAALDLVQRAGSPEKAAERLSRATGVTDDLFGHWLQRLDGRQVVVILDTCMSGGFATAEKGDGRSSQPAGVKEDSQPFDFLDSEMTRLKDIGQSETALLAACHRNEITLTRDELKHSVFTYHLLREMEQSQVPNELNPAFRQILQSMKHYFQITGLQATNDRLQAAGTLAHAMGIPFLVNHCSKPVYLRP